MEDPMLSRIDPAAVLIPAAVAVGTALLVYSQGYDPLSADGWRDAVQFKNGAPEPSATFILGMYMTGAAFVATLISAGNGFMDWICNRIRC